MSDFLFVANHLALDFLNTEMMDQGERIDALDSPEALVAWSREVGVLGEGEVLVEGELSLVQVWERALWLRDGLRVQLEHLHRGEAYVGGLWLEALSTLLAREPGLVRRSVTLEGGEFRQHQQRELGTWEELLVVLADAFADLLTMQDPARIKTCDGHACILYFLDTSKNGRRRWCSMELCGSRVKAKAYYRRKQGAK